MSAGNSSFFGGWDNLWDCFVDYVVWKRTSGLFVLRLKGKNSASKSKIDLLEVFYTRDPEIPTINRI